MPLRNDVINKNRLNGRSSTSLGSSVLETLNLRGGSDDNKSPEESNGDYLEFTMNSDGKTNIEVQAPSLQNELNKTLGNLNELQEKIKDQEASSAGLISANGVANGGAAASGHMSAKFPITREELPHFACMSVLMFLFIYVFTTGEFRCSK